MKKYKADYKARKELKQLAKNTPEKETKEPVIHTTRMNVDPYGVDLMSFAFPMLMGAMLRRKR